MIKNRKMALEKNKQSHSLKTYETHTKPHTCSVKKQKVFRTDQSMDVGFLLFQFIYSIFIKTILLMRAREIRAYQFNYAPPSNVEIST